MHDYTVRLLNEHRLNQFDAEADASRLVNEALKRRGPPDHAKWIPTFMALSVPRRVVQHVRWALMRVHGA
ncbi:MAG: hypothetical protein ACR2I5_13585 [Candidatus Limnocylindria bacterium]